GITDNYDYNIEALAPIDIHRKWDFFNPKVGINFTDSLHHRAFASWSVAHREPVRDNFTDGDRRHDPDAERMFDYELGYTYSHPLFSLGINLYYMDYKDQLVLTGQLSDTGNALSVNVPSSYRMGIELQGALRPCSWFDWEINATLSRNRIKDFTEWIYDDAWENDPLEIHIGSTPIAFSPSVTAKNAFNFNHRGLEASLLTQYVGKQYLSNIHSSDQMLKAYCVSDLELGYDFAKGCRRLTERLGVRGLRIGFIVHNLFNARYENNGYAYTYYLMDEHDKPVIYRESGYAAQAGTNVMGTVTIKF
ncbi:MAG: TonB-dependent receptor, partial [Duncaniella sp.]|nr:TonB-dependent receptor [Duncaniella sp.]